MAAAMNGMALHGGIIPYSGTFLVFSDYCRPAIRLAALMGERVIHVMTHDSIGLGEDGPTHQPVEHLAALRAIPNLLVFRPCDTVETLECWQLALEASDSPSVLALTRQNLPQLRKDDVDARISAPPAPTRSLRRRRQAPRSRCSPPAPKSRSRSRRRSCSTRRACSTRVVSVPCFELFAGAGRAERARRHRRRAGQGRASRPACARAGTRSSAPTASSSACTASAPARPYKDLYKHFGITPRRSPTRR